MIRDSTSSTLRFIPNYSTVTCCKTPREISVSEETTEKSGRKSPKSPIDPKKLPKVPACCRNGDECTVAGNCVCKPPKPTGPNDANQNPTSSRETYDVFLGGSCGTTVWRRQSVIPFLKKRGITYYDPQRSFWSENMIYEESIAKESSSLFLFVIDPATVNATSFLEIAYFAARKSPKLVVVFLGKTEWAEKAHPEDLPDRNRTCQLLDRILECHQVPMLHTIPEALDFIEEEMLGRQTFGEAMKSKNNRLPYIQIRARRVVRNVKSVAAHTVKICKSYATSTVIAGLIDTAILLVFFFTGPAWPLYYVLIPVLLITAAILGVYHHIKHLQRRYPRMVGDSSAIMYNATPAIPSPRVTVKTTSVNGTIRTTTMMRRRSKQNFEKLFPEETQSTFILPQNFLPKKETKVNIDCSVVELCSSSLDDNNWVQELAAPTLNGKGTPYSYVLATPNFQLESRMNCLQTWFHHHKKFFYYIPSTTTFLSGMVEIAYILGHTNWEGTVCVPSTSQILEGPDDIAEDEKDHTRAARRRRNDCYQIAFCYLKDMAKRRQCRVFTDIAVAVKALVDPSIRGV
ncbi:unnamed protein product [Caenorhabditis sp. 36 PRJEB53466]|nr:unnamed protein product [Caenorhabditis sp. 36 PRJEB53466]